MTANILITNNQNKTFSFQCIILRTCIVDFHTVETLVMKISDINTTSSSQDTDEKTSNNDTDLWTFVLNNKHIFKNVSRLHFTENKYDNKCIQYFEKKLTENNIIFESANQINARYTLSKDLISFYGENEYKQIISLADYLHRLEHKYVKVS